MLINFKRVLSQEEFKLLEAQIDLTTAVEPTVERLYNQHMTQSKRWYPHTIVPWGVGIDYIEKEWAEEQASLPRGVRMALETNLLTEDNLPYYHENLVKFLNEGSIWQKWNRRWVAEEDNHGSSLRDYLYLTRNADPIALDDNRQAIMEAGFERNFDPVSIFVYTTVQELATRVTHINTGRISQEPVLKKLTTFISNDENRHFIFYRDVLKAMLDIAPEQVLPSIVKELYTFAMPGTGMPDFKERMEVIADLGIYGPREHRDHVIKPILAYWGIADLKGLKPEVVAVQEKVLKYVALLDRIVEQRERRKRKSDSE